MTASLVIFGWLADRNASRQLPFLAGLVSLFFSTSIFLFSYNPSVMIIARLLQGASAGIVYTVGLALLVDTVGHDQTGAWMGYSLSGLSVGFLIGPFLGGIVFEKAGYHALFLVLLGIIAIEFVLRLFVIEKKTATKWLIISGETRTYDTFSEDANNVDRSGSNSSQESLISTKPNNCNKIENRTAIETSNPSCERTRLLHSSKTILERPKRYFPVLWALINSSRITVAMYGGFVDVFLLTSIESILPLYLKSSFHWTSSTVGLVFLVLSIPNIASALAGALSDRFGTRRVVLLGFIMGTVGFACLVFITHQTVGQVASLCILLAVIGE